MGPGLTALLVFIALIIIWAVVLKRNIVEAAILSLIILPFFGGVDQAPRPDDRSDQVRSEL